ncbi:hypothetical protein WJX74_006701 [Apatococcus lobatus]|uniref:HotDog ACOT-type domain-containing protein n=2 Tax=Apatococcus TaxID=904362 RepID=A0AAW1Q5M8_9CHLO
MGTAPSTSNGPAAVNQQASTKQETTEESIPPIKPALPQASKQGLANDQDVEALSSRIALLEKQLAELALKDRMSQPDQQPRSSPPSQESSPAREDQIPGFCGNQDSQAAQETAAAAAAEAEIAMGTTRVVMHQLVLPACVDLLGICFGGQVLSWIDICAGLAAKTVARGPVVTASVDSVHFIRPVRKGSVAIIAAMVNRTFKSSMEVGVRVEEEDVQTGARHHCCSAYLTFVSVQARDAPGRSGKPLPRIIPGAGRQQEVYAAAEARRNERLAMRKSKSAGRSSSTHLQPVTHREGMPTLAPPVRLVGLKQSAQRQMVSPARTMAHMTQLIMPQNANSLGITFGGQVMGWMEQCAYIAASRVGRGGHLLTGSMDSIAFARSTRIGDIMYISSMVTGIFGSSVEVMISVHGETPSQGMVFHCGDAFATIVSVDLVGNPVPIPFELDPAGDVELERCSGAEDRRGQRLRDRTALHQQQQARFSLDGTAPLLEAPDLRVPA